MTSRGVSLAPLVELASAEPPMAAARACPSADADLDPDARDVTSALALPKIARASLEPVASALGSSRGV